MNIKHLEAFTKIMATGTLGAAADDMSMSISAVSRQLCLLEDDLDLKLFHRIKKRLVPTEEGESLYLEAERMLRYIRQFPEIVDEIRRSAQRQMRIIVTPRISSSIAAPAVATFMDENPDVEMSIDVQPPGFVERWVVGRKFDLGIGALPARHSDLETESICRVPAVAVLPPGHRLASHSTVSVESLSDERLILMTDDTLLGQQMADILRMADVVPKPPIRVNRASVCCNLAAQGLGVTIMDPMTPQSLGSAVTMRPIEPATTLDFGLLYLRGTERTNETKRFAEIVRGQAKAFMQNLSLS